ncbi:MAG: UDP-N-acetylmuramoyl-L-alanyl-D-glutamate--2,6-diaminopimelate ligase [Ruminococcaceae bacterium]|nr:UDP-N-acetylmuramoyl-L-alanyl-D-glutamate--2,6-diaminopimelate ligase [Oscillospiraceae bacterium]
MSVSLFSIIAELSNATLSGQAPSKKAGVSAVCVDSRKSSEDSLFVCIKGFTSDGHAYARKAYDQGCRYFLVERILDLPDDALQILVPDTRIAEAEAAAAFYGHPEREMDLFAITGTKGKTTTALFLQKILNDAGVPTGYMGTNGIIFGDKHYPTVNSTPDSLLIYAYLREMLDAGMIAAVMEVSSQGLKLYRTYGLSFRVCAFTNLSPDHIGGNEHPDMADYAACKHRLFTDYPHDFTVCNLDDPALPDMTKGDPADIVGFSTKGHPDAAWTTTAIQGVIRNGIPGMEYGLKIQGLALSHMHFLPQPGEFNVKNALCAMAMAHLIYGIPVENACKSLETATVPGRFETVFHDHVLYVIDYAHNAVSMASMLDLLRSYHPERLICLFGSVGERTKERRRELAEVTGIRADLCILTSDNPGREDPEAILREIDAAYPEGSCPRVMISDRTEAVAYAVSVARPGDMILLAGKGHETYQLVGEQKVAYREKNVLLNALSDYASGNS